MEAKPSLGLRVVSRPEKALESIKKQSVEKVKEEENLEPKEKLENGKEYYKEKVHRFTPIYTPPVKKKDSAEDGASTSAESKDGAKAPNKEAGDAQGVGANKKVTTTSTTETGDSKKRLGGLASMMSTKKTTINRAQTLTQSRADSELKSYGALGSLGRPLYTQVKRKKIFHGMGGKTQITKVKESKRVIHVYKGVYFCLLYTSPSPRD